jgi:hypothetical protein
LHLLFSALFILSDHGSRDSEVRKTRQGQLEDRLPLAYVILPQWFSQKYPQAVKNLRGNAKHITSAYDMYETFKDLTDLSKLNDQHIHYIRQRKLKVAEKVYESRIGCSLYNFDFFFTCRKVIVVEQAYSHSCPSIVAVSAPEFHLIGASATRRRRFPSNPLTYMTPCPMS